MIQHGLQTIRAIFCHSYLTYRNQDNYFQFCSFGKTHFFSKFALILVSKQFKEYYKRLKLIFENK